MITDAGLQFSASQALTATAASTNIVDFGAVRDIGSGENLYVVLDVTVALTDSGSDTTVTVDFQTDDNSAFGSQTTKQTLFTIPATSAAGTMLIARLAPGAANERYGRLNYTMNNGNLTTGTVSAQIVHDVFNYTAYPKGYTIS